MSTDPTDGGAYSTLHAQAKIIAEGEFATAGTLHPGTVCVVAISLTKGRETRAMLSGSPGYKALRDHVADGGSIHEAGNRITGSVTRFLRSSEGGGFSPGQITGKEESFAVHGRGAMNCAEPKMRFLLAEHERRDLANWVLIPFIRQDGGDVVIYWPPCRNCRRWVYRHFHALSARIARAYGPGDALEGAVIPG